MVCKLRLWILMWFIVSLFNIFFEMILITIKVIILVLFIDEIASIIT